MSKIKFTLNAVIGHHYFLLAMKDNFIFCFSRYVWNSRFVKWPIVSFICIFISLRLSCVKYSAPSIFLAWVFVSNWLTRFSIWNSKNSFFYLNLESPCNLKFIWSNCLWRTRLLWLIIKLSAWLNIIFLNSYLLIILLSEKFSF